jgi:hypothetical protein
MKGIITAIAAATLLITSNTHAAYKCNFAGRVVLTQTPCHPGAKEVEIKAKELTLAPKQERPDKANEGKIPKR